MHYSFALQSVFNNLASLAWLVPVFILAIGLGSILVCWLLLPRQYYWLNVVAIACMVLALYSTYWLGCSTTSSSKLVLCNQLLVLDSLSIFFCMLLMGITLFMLLLTRTLYPSGLAHRPVYQVLVLGALLSACLLVMAYHWLMVYLSLTLLSLTSAMLIGMSATPQSAEASLKYWVYGAVSSSMMLWGISYFYGATGTLVLGSPALVPVQAIPWPLCLTGMLLILSSILGMLAAVPYHFWVADVYQGASAAVIAYLSTVPKLACVAILLRFFDQLLSQLGTEHAQNCMASLALLTLVVGHVAALLQNNLQRMMAYASMAQGGLMMAGIVAYEDSPAGVLYYSIVYGVMSLAAWLGIHLLQRLTAGEGVCFQDYVGAGRQWPVLSSCITLGMFSLIGLPPTAGFTAKWLILLTLWGMLQRTGSVLTMVLFVAIVLGTVLSAYYYLKLPYVLFCKPIPQPTVRKAFGWSAQIMLLLLTLLLLWGFFSASSLLKLLIGSVR